MDQYVSQYTEQPQYVTDSSQASLSPNSWKKDSEFVGNRAKSRISKRLKQAFQENKAREIFRKTKISYSLIRTCTCAY